jgi:hypothetical protein
MTEFRSATKAESELFQGNEISGQVGCFYCSVDRAFEDIHEPRRLLWFCKSIEKGAFSGGV